VRMNRIVKTDVVAGRRGSHSLLVDAVTVAAAVDVVAAAGDVVNMGRRRSRCDGPGADDGGHGDGATRRSRVVDDGTGDGLDGRRSAFLAALAEEDSCTAAESKAAGSRLVTGRLLMLGCIAAGVARTEGRSPRMDQDPRLQLTEEDVIAGPSYK